MSGELPAALETHGKQQGASERIAICRAPERSREAPQSLAEPQIATESPGDLSKAPENPRELQ
eukprot:15115836-Alexandrium_andersonii.AAC.1